MPESAAIREARSEARAWCRKAGLMEGRAKAAEGELDKARFEREEIQERLDHAKQKLTECRERWRDGLNDLLRRGWISRVAYEALLRLA